MKSSHRLGLTLLAGAALGAATIWGVQAQGKPPVYAVIEIDQVTDADAFMKAVIPRPNPKRRSRWAGAS